LRGKQARKECLGRRRVEDESHGALGCLGHEQACIDQARKDVACSALGSAGDARRVFACELAGSQNRGGEYGCDLAFAEVSLDVGA
jgi:hypothetical protein